MSERNGDKARFSREQKKRNLHRKRIRDLRKILRLHLVNPIVRKRAQMMSARSLAISISWAVLSNSLFHAKDLSRYCSDLTEVKSECSPVM